MGFEDSLALVLSHSDRRTGSEAEQNLLDALSSRLGALGLDAWVEPCALDPSPVPLQFVAAGLMIAGASLHSWGIGPGLLLLLLGLVSVVGEAIGTGGPLRLLLGRRLGACTVGRLTRPGARATVVLTAHVDAPPEHFSRELRSTFRRRWPGRRPTRDDVLAASGSLLLLLALLGREGPLAAVLSVAALALGLSVFLWAGLRALARTSPGAVANASGVAALLELAASQVDASDRPLDLWFVATGGGAEHPLGMEAFLRRFHTQLPRSSTFFVNLVDPGAGHLGYALGEGAKCRPHHPMLPALVARVSADLDPPIDGGWLLRQTDAWAASTRGYRAVSLVGTSGRSPRPGSRGDTLQRVDRRTLRQAVDLAELVIASLEGFAHNLRPLAPTDPVQLAREAALAELADSETREERS